MSGAEVSSYVSAVKWSDDSHYLGEFARQFELPQVARIVKGQYRQLGVSNLPSLNQVILLTTAGPRLKVAAQSVKFKDGRRAQPVSGAKLAIPENYEGWFEILSEEGRSSRCIEGVAELARRGPALCLLREPVKCFVGRIEDPETPSEKTKVLQAGETLTLAGEMAAVKGHRRCLKCYTSKGEALFLSMEQRCRFSAVAGEESISGVHTIRTLARKRFPMMVRLVHGRPPPGLKSFVPEMRLHSLFQEDKTLVALPLLKEPQRAVALPPGLPLKLQAPRNVEALLKMREHGRIREWCQRLAQEAADRIQVLEPIKRKHVDLSPPKPCRAGPQRSFSDPCEPFDDRRYEEIDQIYDYVRGFAPLPEKIKSDFVLETSSTNAETNSSTNAVNGGVPDMESSLDVQEEVVEAKTVDDVKSEKEVKPPEPPPIETIPARRASTGDTTSTRKVQHLYEKVQNTRLPVRSNSAGKVTTNTSKLFQKSTAQQQRSRLFKHSKSSPALKESRKEAVKKPSSSPLFHIRYKSLTNLMDFNTLDSSHSGQTSSGSAGSAAKRSKLPRPKSLTNLLVWEDTRNKYNVLQSKFIFTPANSTKRLGTLYL